MVGAVRFELTTLSTPFIVIDVCGGITLSTIRSQAVSKGVVFRDVADDIPSVAG
jgi:hypothetical protein